eukprot:CAMPEP_0172627546 /NCGR_PEP_ID=MMETSP1068-20121228/156809_1 /TAXON_ID=35684 /ORGANISM="Pseudopedinella elastica, Strain CCMP716" /LENGTH=216 /DNA_ID=CAMNT_0013437467 /DNA_START=8 /DNA_END=658 /DNA_ORIENTATION=+
MANAETGWKAVNFCNWYIWSFYKNIHAHHENEEMIYFPFLATRAKIPPKVTADHVELMKMMDTIKTAAEKIVSLKGVGCAEFIDSIQVEVSRFVPEMREHLKEEEEIVPNILRANFTQAEEKKAVEAILKRGGLAEARSFLPSIALAMEEWASEDILVEFKAEIPKPISHLLDNYYLPDYKNTVVQMRESPSLCEIPKLQRVPCCQSKLMGFACCI